jgi:hypothetical protein
MAFESILLVILVVSTFIIQGTQLYLHFDTYPLLAHVGRAEFSAYLSEFERRFISLTIVPFSLSVLSNLGLVVFRPDELRLTPIVVALVLIVVLGVSNSGSGRYRMIKQAGEATPIHLVSFMEFNLLRLSIASFRSLLVLYILYTVLAD